ncbi:MAG TPA: M24 family metallopeptidase [Solirubrobacteraceae bacterium]
MDLIGTSGTGAGPAPSRFDRIRSELKADECDALVAFGSLHAAHLAGYDRYLSDLADLVAVVVTADGDRTLVCGRLEVPAAVEDSDADDIRGFGHDDLLALDSSPALAAACRQVVGNGRLAVAGRSALVELLGGDAEPFDDVLERIRRVKDRDEVARIAEATRLAFLAQGVVEQRAASGQSEIALFSAARSAAEEMAGSPVGWVCTVAAGEHSALISPPFCIPGSEPVPAGAPLLCDISVRHRGYWGDTTRTYGGDTEVASVRDAVTRVLHEMAVAASPGLPASTLYAVGRDAIASRIAGATALPHHGGHSLGVEIGERPQILPEDPMQLAEGMVLALEPAAYFAGRFGVRVENTYVVTADGARRVEEVVA